MGNGPYWDRTLNFLRGCSRCSPGCGDATGGGCWAERMANRHSGEGRPFHGLVKGGRWTGEVRFVPEVLEKPLHTRKPGRWFLDMSDPFHPAVGWASVAAAVGVFAAAQSQTLLLLTKRPARMLGWATQINAQSDARQECCWQATNALGRKSDDPVALAPAWPPRNVLMGATICNQPEADRHLTVMRQLAALGWRTWISFEPLLGPVVADLRGIEWIVPGCESGPRRRLCRDEWLRDLCTQGTSAGCRVFLKQVQSTAARIVVSDPAAAEWPAWGVRQLPEVTP